TTPAEETTPPSQGSETTSTSTVQTTTSATSIYSSTESTVISSSSVEKEIVTKVTTNKENQLPLTGEQATPYLLAIVVSLFGLAILLLRRQHR
ncbi:TPA: LPXTG cell wall anchor domain-containing protein, partial [Streptococcus suis]